MSWSNSECSFRYFNELSGLAMFEGQDVFVHLVSLLHNCVCHSFLNLFIVIITLLLHVHIHTNSLSLLYTHLSFSLTLYLSHSSPLWLFLSPYPSVPANGIGRLNPDLLFVFFADMLPIHFFGSINKKIMNRFDANSRPCNYNDCCFYNTVFFAPH